MIIELLMSNQRYKLFEVVLLFAGLLYYLVFFNKGLVLFDEGYFVHAADRILSGEMPYKDFSLQYAPAYFYVLALLFKIFGSSIIAERFFAVAMCLAILAVTFLILNKLRANSYPVIFLSFLCVIAYGYPLMNIANIMWANVLTALLTVLVYLHWHSSNERRGYMYLIIMGTLLALSLCLKQNIGLVCFLVCNFLVLFSKKRSALQIIREAAVLNGICVLLTVGWIYYFFLRDNISGLLAVIEYSRKFAQSTAFTLPPLTFIRQPFGIFKLLPYYTPLAFAVFLMGYLFRQKKDWGKFAFAIMAVTGFAVTIFPQSDLLHVYPFLGSTLVSILLFSYTRKKFRIFMLTLISIHILIGFYLTLFTRSYRYEAYYSQTNTPLPLPRTAGILVEKHQASDLIALSNFMKTHTKQNDYILAYPYWPMLYFILERRNPTKDPIYYLRTWHFYDDTVAINDMRHKNVKYIVVAGAYKFDTDLSRIIQKQKLVFSSSFLVYQIIAWK